MRQRDGSFVSILLSQFFCLNSFVSMTRFHFSLKVKPFMRKGTLTQNNVHLQDHEFTTVKLLLDLGFDIELIPKSQIPNYRQPDIMMDGIAWDIKAPIGTGRKNIENVVQGAVEQSRNIIVDLFRSKMPEDDAIKGYEKYFKASKRIKRMKIIKKNREIIDFSK